MRIALLILIVLVLAAGGFYLWSRRPALAPVNPNTQTALDPALVSRGAQLARIGDCNICHTAAGGAVYAGGRAVPTPFGTLYSSNITPDPDTGIGRWSRAAFRRAMRRGVGRQGRHLYPAFPYPHFTLLSDEDIGALYAFMMTRTPVHAVTPANRLAFPLNFRPLLAAWKLLFFHPRRYRADPRHGKVWNRGAYLAQGLGHCAACHSPRNVLGAEKRGGAFGGGEAEGWDAPALNGDSPAPVAWSAPQLFEYLRTGFSARHGAAAGPMAAVTRNLAHSPARDVRALSVYFAALMHGAVAARRPANAAPVNGAAGGPGAGHAEDVGNDPGAVLFAGACARCHSAGAAPGSARGIDLALSSAVNLPEPRNVIHIIRAGIQPPEGQRGKWMPAFAGTFTREQMAALLTYLRARFTQRPPWRHVSSALSQP